VLEPAGAEHLAGEVEPVALHVLVDRRQRPAATARPKGVLSWIVSA
jgi:hypothetical protein